LMLRCLHLGNHAVPFPSIVQPMKRVANGTYSSTGLKGGNLVGMISIGDIVNAIIMNQKEHIRNLEQYIQST